jgi:hypothetical protein
VSGNPNLEIGIGAHDRSLTIQVGHVTAHDVGLVEVEVDDRGQVPGQRSALRRGAIGRRPSVRLFLGEPIGFRPGPVGGIDGILTSPRPRILGGRIHRYRRRLFSRRLTTTGHGRGRDGDQRQERKGKAHH